MIKASVYGEEVKILDYSLSKNLAIPYCKVQYKDRGWVCIIPQACIDIMYVGT